MQELKYPRSLRLLTGKDFSRVFDKADFKVHGKGMMVLARYSLHDHPRIGLIVGKKNVKLAVQRNRFKRVVRESARLRQRQLPALDIVVLAKRGAAELDNHTLYRQLHGVWQRLQRDEKQSSKQQGTLTEHFGRTL